MSQTTNDQNESGYTWARRPGTSSESPDAARGSTPPDMNSTATIPSRENARENVWVSDGSPAGSTYPPQMPAGYPSQTQAGYAAQTQAGYPAQVPVGYATTQPSSGGLPPEAPAYGSGSGGGRREPRRPTWSGVIAMGIGTAALASLLTAGVLRTQDSDSSAALTTGTTTANDVKGPVNATGTVPNWGKVAKAVEPSVVAVKVTGQSAEGEGSGVILDKTGRIVTNNHVVSGVGGDPTIQVVLQDGRTYPATVVGTDSQTDLAVIKLKNGPNNLTPAVLGNSNSLAVGDPVMAVGNPLGLSGTVTTGIVSATDRPTQTAAESSDPTTSSSGEGVVTNAIQTDAAVNPGNSGGALVDSQGRVVGIPSSIASLGAGSSLGGQATQSGNIGLGFAIPVDEVKDVTGQLIKTGTVKHSWLGVTLQNNTVKVGGATRDAAVLKSIVSGAPADKAGLKVGDAVIAVDGEAVNGDLSLIGQLRERPVNTTVTLSIVRNGSSSDVKVTLGSRPASAG
jgi:putative serine protease PepD